MCNLHFLTAVNSVIPQEGKHYVTIFVGGRVIEEGMKPQVSIPINPIPSITALSGHEMFISI